MQQEQNRQKQQELKKLEQLIEQSCSGNHTGNDQLHQLCIKYPHQAVLLVKKHATLDLQPSGSPLLKAYIYALSLDRMYYGKLKHYLVRPPADEKHKKEFNRAVEVFEDIILRQNKDN